MSNLKNFPLFKYCQDKSGEWAGAETGFVLSELIASKLAKDSPREVLQASLLYQDFLGVLLEDPLQAYTCGNQVEGDYEEYEVSEFNLDDGWML